MKTKRKEEIQPENIIEEWTVIRSEGHWEEEEDNEADFDDDDDDDDD
jgi:hypothetical protein